MTRNLFERKHSRFSCFAGHSRTFSNSPFSFRRKQIKLKLLSFTNIFSLTSFQFANRECFLLHEFPVIRYIRRLYGLYIYAIPVLVSRGQTAIFSFVKIAVWPRETNTGILGLLYSKLLKDCTEFRMFSV